MDMIQVLNKLGSGLISTIGPLSLELALWTAVVLLILAVLRVQSPALRHLAWVLVLLKPLTTLLLQSPISVYSLLPSLAEEPLPASGILMPGGQIAPSAMPVPMAVAATTPPLSGYGILALLWGAIAIVLLLRLIAGKVFLVRLLRWASRVHSGPLHHLLQEAATGLGVRRPVQLALAEEGGPLVAGILRPVVILPRHLAKTLSPEQLRLIFAHELAHVRRLDNLALLGQQLVEALLFFHPSTWLCRRGLRLEAEKACDDAVLHRFPQPAHYANSLARVAELCSSQRSNLLINTFAAAESRLGWRITRVLEAKPVRRSPALTSAAVLVLVSASCFGLPEFTDQPSEQLQVMSVRDSLEMQDTISGTKADSALRLRQEENLINLATLFNKIQAANAAEILQRNSELSDTTVARLMQKLQPAQRAKIMGLMEPVFAAHIAKLTAEIAETGTRPSDSAQLPYYYEATGIRKIMCDRPGDPLHPVLVSLRMGLIDETGGKTAADLARDATLPQKMDPYMKKIRAVIFAAIGRTTQDQLRDVEHLTSIKEEIRGTLNREVFSEAFPSADTSGGRGVIRLSEILFSEMVIE